MATVTFVNHSSFLLEIADVALLSDPWLDGTAFDSGWALLSPTAFRPENFRDVSHIWYSHEHPDHFHPPSLAKVPADARGNIQVLYQTTRDGKVAEYCRAQGFPVRELPPRWAALTPNVHVFCCPHGQGDSWLALKADGFTMLNLNDCNVETEAELQAIVHQVGKVDLLLTQFSYAMHVPTREARRKFAGHLLDRIALQCEITHPSHVIPFASFIWWCHVENVHLNDEINTIRRTYEHLSNAVSAQCVVLYPGDRWTVGAPWDNASSLARYDRDYAALSDRPLQSSQPVEPDDLVSASREFAGRLMQLNSWAYLRSLRPSLIFVSDYERAFEFEARHGLTAADAPRSACDISLSSSALRYCFKNLWGGATLNVNGRFTIPSGRGDSQFFEWLWLANKNNQGEHAGVGSLLRSRGRWYARKLGLIDS